MTYLRARYYNNGTGRFFTKDPWNGSPYQPMSYDLYLYAYNNPIMYTDPSGEIISYNVEGNPITDLPYESKKLTNSILYGRYIPEPDYDYDIVRDADHHYIVTDFDDDIDKIAYTVYGEGGSLQDKMGANVISAYLHRAQIYWNHQEGGRTTAGIHDFINPSNVPWSMITRDQLIRLLLYVASERTIRDSGPWPAIDAWSQSQSIIGYGESQFEDIRIALQQVLDQAGTDTTILDFTVGGIPPDLTVLLNPDVIYWYSSDPPWEDYSSVVEFDFACGRFQYYGMEPIH